MEVGFQRYSTIAIVLHWAIAAAILYNFYLGLAFDKAHGLERFQLFQLHKSVGVTVLGLTLLRIVWRLVSSPAPLPDGVSDWERIAAKVTHLAFYALMLLLPVTGWIIVSASPTNIPTLLYKLVPFPFIGPVHALPMAARKTLEAQVGEVHSWLAWIMIALFVLHVAAALKHQFWNRDGVLYRMAPFLRFGLRP